VRLRHARRLAALALLAFAAAAAAATAQDFSKVEIKATQLSEGTYMLTGAGGNIGLSVGEDAAFLIDDQYAPLTDRIKAAIARITPKPVRFVLNTHWHRDHVGGNESFGKAGALIVAHENVRRRMGSEQLNEFMRTTTPPSPKGALPVVTFDGAVSFHLNGEEIRAVHVPRAHTDGDAIVHFLGSDVVHMGDVFWNGMYPFIDTASGGSVKGTLAACDKVLAIVPDAARIIPGHGPLSNKAGLQAYRDMLAGILARIEPMVREGRKVEEIVAAKPTAQFDEKWGKGFIKPPRFAEMVAADLLRNP
jgi:glyoxylase-like metal-dependent hydrolase (beta-lactamase superfamily II)